MELRTENPMCQEPPSTVPQALACGSITAPVSTPLVPPAYVGAFGSVVQTSQDI